MADERVKMRLWRGLTKAEKHARYYSHRADQQKKWETRVSILVLSASSVSVLTLLATVLPEITSTTSGGKFFSSSLPEIISVILVSSAGFATIVDMKKNFAGEAANALWIKNECRNLVNSWERLWEDRDNARVMELATELENRLEYVTREEIEVNHKLNKRFEEEAEIVIRSRLTPGESKQSRETRTWGFWRKAVA